MFESIISKVTHFVCGTIRAVGTATRKTPWLASIAILALFLVVS